MQRITFPALVCAIVLLYVIPAISEDKKPTEESVKAVWTVAEPAFKVKEGKEKLAPTVTFSKDGKVTISNRGYLQSKIKYSYGITFRTKWMWSSEEPMVYPDHLCIVIRGNGKTEGKYPFEAEGLRLKFNPAAKAVMAELQKDGVATSLGRSEDEVLLAEKQVYDIEVIDNEDHLIVKVNGNEVLRQKVQPLDGGETYHVLAYNREPVGGFVKASVLENPTITEKEKK